MHLYTYVRFVDEGDLPAGHDFMAYQEGEHLAIFIRRDRITERLLEEAWDAARECWQQAGMVFPILPRHEGTGLPVPFDPTERRAQLALVHSA